MYVTEILVERNTPIETKKQDNIQVPEHTKTEYDNSNTEVELTDEDLPF